MLKFTTKTTDPVTPESTLTLSFDQRNKSRLKATLDDGRDIGIVLENGKHLQQNDILISDKMDKEKPVVIQIKAALETV
ncbi:MAG: urease accessory protein UreE, partial [Gammaproteobacteria bacterium]|nr:urease accessory protein UreE [Gammaproteobacteria bacterium]